MILKEVIIRPVSIFMNNMDVPRTLIKMDVQEASILLTTVNSSIRIKPPLILNISKLRQVTWMQVLVRRQTEELGLIRIRIVQCPDNKLMNKVSL